MNVQMTEWLCNCFIMMNTVKAPEGVGYVAIGWNFEVTLVQLIDEF